MGSGYWTDQGPTANEVRSEWITGKESSYGSNTEYEMSDTTSTESKLPTGSDDISARLSPVTRSATHCNIFEVTSGNNAVAVSFA